MCARRKLKDSREDICIGTDSYVISSGMVEGVKLKQIYVARFLKGDEISSRHNDGHGGPLGIGEIPM